MILKRARFTRCCLTRYAAREVYSCVVDESGEDYIYPSDLWFLKDCRQPLCDDCVEPFARADAPAVLFHAPDKLGAGTLLPAPISIAPLPPTELSEREERLHQRVQVLGPLPERRQPFLRFPRRG